MTAPFADIAKAHAVMTIVNGKVVYEAGDPEHGIWSAGMVQGLIHDIPSCEELISRIVREAEEIIHGRLARLSTARPSVPA